MPTQPKKRAAKQSLRLRDDDDLTHLIPTIPESAPWLKQFINVPVGTKKQRDADPVGKSHWGENEHRAAVQKFLHSKPDRHPTRRDWLYALLRAIVECRGDELKTQGVVASYYEMCPKKSRVGVVNLKYGEHLKFRLAKDGFIVVDNPFWLKELEGRPVKKGLTCCVCFEPITKVLVLLPCAHANVCGTCAAQLEKNYIPPYNVLDADAARFSCPSCRTLVADCVNIFQ